MATTRARLLIAIVSFGALGGALVGYMGRADEPRLQEPRASGHPTARDRSEAPSNGLPPPDERAPTGDRSDAARAGAIGSSGPAVRFDGTLRSLIVAGGAYPASTEVSLEQNAALAEQVLPSPSLTLFAGGPGSMSVRTLDPDPERTLLRRLGDLFQPRVGRASTYRSPKLEAEPATVERFETYLERALGDGREPLVLYVAAHGEQGQARQDNVIVLWGGESVSVKRLAALHDRNRRRPLVVISTTCFSGGFAELAFAGADPSAGVTRAPRCGFFAGTWDREASGCDPNPDRRAQESYSQHMLNALRGRNRDGRQMEPAALDLDGDGSVSFLEAHQHAAIRSVSIDVPTTTSERFLRIVQSDRAPVDADRVVEYGAVIRELGEGLGVGTEGKARERFEKVGARLDALDEQLRKAEGDLDRSYAALSTRLLERWPVLDDPYHADFSSTLARNGEAIRRVLDDSSEARRFRADQAKLDELDAYFVELQIQESRLLRLLRAYETLGKVAALERRGGSDWRHYQRLLDCERTAPRQP